MYKEKIFFNKKANIDYDFFESYIAGIQLLGSEIKSIRLNNLSISDSFCKMQRHELYVINMFISKNKLSTAVENSFSRRERKLLLKSLELRKIEYQIKKSGFTIIPNQLFFSKKGFAKLKISLAKAKKKKNKRFFLKNKEI